MKNEELARQIGASPYVNRHYPGVTYLTFSPEKLDAYTDAAIKAHEAKLIEGVGELTDKHDHPEPHTMKWTQLEIDYINRRVAAAAAKVNAEITNLHTVMMAAAVEITEHWDAHCDAEGYGPANLVRRLENCFPAQYGYDAQTVVSMEKRIAELTETNSTLADALGDAEERIATLEAALRVALEALEEATTYTSSPSWSPSMTEDCNKAIKQAKGVLK